ncbi:MAG: PorT family protein [Bacteroidales bacterium]|nr:PorT family protein [Bacteroidales bacterium]
MVKRMIILLVALFMVSGMLSAQNYDEPQRRRDPREGSQYQPQQMRTLDGDQWRERERQKREAAKAQNKAMRKQKAAQNKTKRRGNYSRWGRGPRVGFDPYGSLLTDRRLYGRNNQYNSVGFNVGGVLEYRQPIGRRFNFNVGLGYRWTYYTYSHLDITSDDFDVNGFEQHRDYHSILAPMKIALVEKNNKRMWYAGITPATNIGMVSVPTSSWNIFRLDVTLGMQNRLSIFSPGVEVYYNLLPTYNDGVGIPIHEFGLRFSF